MATALLPSAVVALTDLFGEVLGIPKNEWTANGATTAGAAVPFSLVVNEAIDAGIATVGKLTTANGEVLNYNAVNTGTKTFTINARAQEGTTAAAIDSGSAVGQYLTRDQVNQVFQEIRALSRLAAFPARETLAGGAQTIDLSDTTKAWNRWFQLTGNPAITLTNPPTRGWVTLLMEQDATGGRAITWTTTINWRGGTAPSPSTAAGKFARYDLMWTGTDWLGDAAYDFK